MLNYEKMSTDEVLRRAKEGDKDALFDMRYRRSNNEEAFGSVWAAYWDQKAAEKGCLLGKYYYAKFLAEKPASDNFKNDRQEAIRLYESIVNAYDEGKLGGNERNVGMAAKIELGVMLCEGLGTKRDHKRGLELIKAGEKDTGVLKRFDHLLQVGELFAMGYAQEDEDPTSSDLMESIGYLEKSISADGGDPRKKEYAGQILETVKKRLSNKIDSESPYPELPDFIDGQLRQEYNELKYMEEQERQEYNLKKAKERREQYEQPRELGLQIDDSMRRLRERLAKEGW